MNKLTKKEQEIVALQKKLRPLSKKDIAYIEKELNTHHGVIRRGKYYCLDCNKTTGIKSTYPALDIEAIKNNIICPHCGKNLKIIMPDNEWKYFNTSGYYHQFNYITYAQKVGKYQVFRTYETHKTQKIRRNKENNEKAFISHYPVFEHWYDENLNKKILRKWKTMYGTMWSKDSKQWTFEKKNKKFYRESISTDDFQQFKTKSMQPWLKKRGFINPCLINISAQEEMENLKKKGFETLIKEKRINLLKGITKFRKYTWEKYWDQIKIANRHKFNLEPQDYVLWFDMIDNLKELRKDTHNPTIICPKNINEAHDSWNEKLKKERWKKERLEQLKKMKLDEKAYEKKISKIKNLILEDKNIIIKPLKTIEEFYNEGEAMHHCVYNNQYYKRENCIILSARRKTDNIRLATIEYNPKTKTIIQCYAAFNKIPEQYKEINELISKNTKKLKQTA